MATTIVTDKKSAGRCRYSPGRGQHLLGGVDVAESICSIVGCDDPVVARSWCNRHYRRWLRRGDPNVVLPKRSVGSRPREPGVCSVDQCQRRSRARGMCGMHYYRWRAGLPVNGKGRVLADVEVRFWEKVEKTDGGCWWWTASLNGKGYGNFSSQGRGGQAHRFAYQSVKGPIPEGLELDHLCCQPRCVNPDHLEPVTRAENVRRAYEARRVP